MLELDPMVLGGIILRTTGVYLVLMFGLRLAGKRELGQMSVFDLVVILLIANALQNAMVGPDTSLTGGIIAALTLLAVNSVVGRIVSREEWLHRRVRGSPTLLVNQGQAIAEHLRAEGLSLDELMMAVREHGFDQLDDVKMAVLEVDGTISIIPRNADHYRTRRRIGRPSI